MTLAIELPAGHGGAFGGLDDLSDSPFDRDAAMKTEAGLFTDTDEDSGVPQAKTGLPEAADLIESGTKSAADALKDAMPHLDDAGAKELERLLKTASAAKGVSVAALVLSIADVGVKWNKYGLDDPRTQESMASLVGGSAGAAIGAALGGPLGAAIGGMIGSYLGPKVADFAKDLAARYGDDVKAGLGKMVDGVEAIGDSIGDAAAAMKDALGAVLGAIGDGLDYITPDLDDIKKIVPDIHLPFF
ncbi:MAG: hypothetical protein KDC46_08450 [Thermoleophilia bacterium]|nr:hypothetical protein [Thermoleophilia bacterium]